MSLSMFSIPFFKVNVEEGHPLHDPCKITLTLLEFSLNESKRIFPPSAATAGFTYSSKILIICCEIESKLSKFFICCFSCLRSASANVSSITVPPFSIYSLMSVRISIVISSQLATSYFVTEM